MLAMYMDSQDFAMVSLDGSRQEEERLEEGKPATALSALDHYISRPATPQQTELLVAQFCQCVASPRRF